MIYGRIYKRNNLALNDTFVSDMKSVLLYHEQKKCCN